MNVFKWLTPDKKRLKEVINDFNYGEFMADTEFTLSHKLNFPIALTES